MAVKIKQYELQKYEYWMAETKHNLPLLLKKPLLVMITSENQIQADLVCIFCIYCLIAVTQYCAKYR